MLAYMWYMYSRKNGHRLVVMEGNFNTRSQQRYTVRQQLYHSLFQVAILSKKMSKWAIKH